jgi:hypothetical protein
LLRGADPGSVDLIGVDLEGVDLLEVWTSLLILHTLIVATVDGENPST